MTPTRRDLLRWSTLASLSHVLGGGPLFAAPSSPPREGEPDSMFLRDNFAPVQDEVDAPALEVVGRIPPDLRGMYVRNGPNPMFKPRGAYHWFDGDGMLHGVHIQDGKVGYRNRYVRTRGLEVERKAGKAVYGGLLDPPDLRDVLRGPQDTFKNAANTALVWHNRSLLALWEAGPPHEIRVPSLETEGVHDFGGELRHNFTAHPKIDPVTGQMRFFGYGILGSLVGYGVVEPDGRISHTATLRMRFPAMMHDFAVTRNYSLFLELPEVFSIEPGKGMFHYKPELGARIGVVPRLGGGDQMRWFEIDPCFVFHTLNAFEDGDKILLYACRAGEFPRIVNHEGATAQARWTPEWAGRPRLCRWTLDLAAGGARLETLDDLDVEFPRCNDALTGQPTRYGYAMAFDFSAHVKYDLASGRRFVHNHGRGRYAGEALFVPRPDSQDEDDGWLLAYVFDEDRGKSELAILDAKSFDSEPVARVLLPVRVPYGFHGAWIPEEAMSS